MLGPESVAHSESVVLVVGWLQCGDEEEGPVAEPGTQGLHSIRSTYSLIPVMCDVCNCMGHELIWYILSTHPVKKG